MSPRRSTRKSLGPDRPPRKGLLGLQAKPSGDRIGPGSGLETHRRRNVGKPSVAHPEMPCQSSTKWCIRPRCHRSREVPACVYRQQKNSVNQPAEQHEPRRPAKYPVRSCIRQESNSANSTSQSPIWQLSIAVVESLRLFVRVPDVGLRAQWEGASHGQIDTA